MAYGRKSNEVKPIDPDDSSSGREICTFVDHSDGTMNLSPRRNLVQGLTVLIFTGIGTTIGFLIVDNRPDIAALVGAVLGMVTGTCLSGFVIMFLPPPKTQRTRTQIQRKYRNCKRQLWFVSAVALLLLVSLPFVISLFGHDDTDLAWLLCLGWPIATIVAYVQSRCLTKRLREWRCPQCHEPLYEFCSACGHCGFPMFPNSQ